MKTRLKEMRKRAGFDRARDFTEHMGISYSTYSAYESGARMMSVETAWRFADALGCTLDELAGRDFHREPPALDAPERALLGDFRTMDSRRRSRLLEDARDYAALSGEGQDEGRGAGIAGA